jgi:hypothetical protein
MFGRAFLKGPPYTKLFIHLYSLGGGVALLLLSIVIRIVATLLHIGQGIQALPRNFRRLAFCTSPTQLPELIPGLEDIDSALKLSSYFHAFYFAKPHQKLRLFIEMSILFVPARATTWSWFAAAPPPPASPTRTTPPATFAGRRSMMCPPPDSKGANMDADDLRKPAAGRTGESLSPHLTPPTDFQGQTKAQTGGQQTAAVLPSVSLPKGGGAIRDLGEKISVNAANGTAGMSLPLPLRARRREWAEAARRIAPADGRSCCQMQRIRLFRLVRSLQFQRAALRSATSTI